MFKEREYIMILLCDVRYDKKLNSNGNQNVHVNMEDKDREYKNVVGLNKDETFI